MSDPDDTDPEAFVDDLPLSDVFGDHPKTRVISALLSESREPTTDFTVSEIARISGLGSETITDHLGDLRSYGIVVETVDVDDESTYSLDD
jgi:Fic family protein